VADMAGGEELAGVSGLGATGHQTTIRKHREREEKMASLSRESMRTGALSTRMLMVALWPAR